MQHCNSIPLFVLYATLLVAVLFTCLTHLFFRQMVTEITIIVAIATAHEKLTPILTYSAASTLSVLTTCDGDSVSDAVTAICICALAEVNSSMEVIVIEVLGVIDVPVLIPEKHVMERSRCKQYPIHLYSYLLISTDTRG